MVCPDEGVLAVVVFYVLFLEQTRLVNYFIKEKMNQGINKIKYDKTKDC